MIKKILIFIVTTVTILATNKKLDTIKDITSTITEKQYINGKEKTKKYNVEYIVEDYLRKKIISPEINKGEIYLYNGKEALIYIPLFDEIIKNNNKEVSNFLNIIKTLKKKEKTDIIFIKNYNGKKVIDLKDKSGYIVRLKRYKVINEYLLPVEIEIFDEKDKVVSLILNNIKVNSGIKRRGIKN